MDIEESLTGLKVTDNRIIHLVWDGKPMVMTIEEMRRKLIEAQSEWKEAHPGQVTDVTAELMMWVLLGDRFNVGMAGDGKSGGSHE